MKRLQQLSDNPIELGYWAFTLAVAVQAFYHVERLAQVVQKYNFGWSSAPGFLGSAASSATVQLLYSAGSVCCLLAVWSVYFKNPGIWRESMAGQFALIFALVLQTFDLAELFVRALLRAESNRAPQGIVGHLLASVELPFWISSAVLAALVVAYVAFRPWGAADARSDRSYA